VSGCQCSFNVKIHSHTRDANGPVQFPTCQQRSLRDCYKIHIPVEANFDPIYLNLFSLQSYLRIIAMLRRCVRWFSVEGNELLMEEMQKGLIPGTASPSCLFTIVENGTRLTR